MKKDIYELAKDQLERVYREAGSKRFTEAVLKAWELESALSMLFLPSAPGYGCPTQVRASLLPINVFSTPDPAVTQELQQDRRIPDCPEEITIDRLQAFVEWQRRFDEEFPQRWRSDLDSHLQRVRTMATEFFGEQLFEAA